MSFYVYIIYSEKYDKYYKGFSLNPEKRLVYHNALKSRYTSNFTPWEIVYIEKLDTKKEALIREKTLKKYAKKQIIQLINSPKNCL